MKRVVSILLVVVMLFSFVGCGKKETPDGTSQQSTTSDSSSSKKVEEVYFFSSIGAYKALLEQEVEKWNNGEGAEKGVRIVMETNIDNYTTALETMIQAGTYPDLADMYAKTDMLKAGYARNLYEVKGIEDLIKRFEPYLAQGVNLHGDKLYSLPLEMVPLKMVYNAEIFEECGLTEPPKTWDELADYAKIITEKGNGKYYGFGWTTMWTASFRRLLMKASISSTGIGYFDNNTGVYDFKPFERGVKAIARMYQEGSMFPTPLDQHIDPIRNRFAEGLVGMEIAPSYDVSVYTSQFPCDFEWKVCEVPALTEDGLVYNGVSLNRGNISITKWVEESIMPAVVEAFKFMHSEELYKKLYSNSAIIPHEARLIEEVKAKGFEYEMPNWSEMSDITYYVAEPVRPDNLITLEGDNFHTVFTNIMLGETTWEAEIESLNKRYNEAYQQAKADGLIDTAIYEAGYNSGKR
jgi:multiple sugar transport system substrate-binding protein